MDPRTTPPGHPSAIVLWTPQMVCKILSISRRTLRSWVKDNILPPPLRLGKGRILRWQPADVVDFLTKTRGHVGAGAMIKELSEGAGDEQRRG